MLSSSPRQSTRLADKPRRTVLGVVNTAPRNLTPLPVKPGQTPEHSGETFAFPAFQLFSNSDVIPRFAAPPGHQQVPAQPDRTGGDLGGLLVSLSPHFPALSTPARLRPPTILFLFAYFKNRFFLTNCKFRICKRSVMLLRCTGATATEAGGSGPRPSSPPAAGSTPAPGSGGCWYGTR